jgi:hypothetical protein
MKVCDRDYVSRFLSKQLEEDDQLDFFYHLDNCLSCWEEVYNAEKAKHPHYYKKLPKRSRKIDNDLRRLEQVGKEEDDMSEVA